LSLTKKEDTDDAKRAYEAFMSWYSVHQFYFTLDSKDVYGWADEEAIYIYPTVFKKAMKELGFNDIRIRKDWANRDWIESKQEEDGKRTTVRKRYLNKMERVIAVKLDISE
jgi:putative DNA primase/helicase